MADAVVAAPAAGEARGAQPAAPGGSLVNTVLRMAVMWLLMSWLRGSGKPKDTSSMFTCKLAKGEAVDMHVYVSTRAGDVGTMVWAATNLSLAAWKGPLSKSIHIGSDILGPIIADNSTAWLTAVFSRDASPPALESALEPDAAALPPKEALSFYAQTKLVTHRPPPKIRTGKYLLGGDVGSGDEAAASALPPATLDDPTPEAVDLRPWIPYWKPNITIAVVDDFGPHAPGKLPPYFEKLAQLDTTTRSFFPLVTLSEFWLLKDKMVPLNATVGGVDLHLDVTTLSAWWLQMQMAMEQSFEMQSKGGMMQDSESDDLKRIFIEGNPWLLGVTTVVSVLHSVFDMLAFKNDIGFWKSNKSMEGLSARTIVINALCQLIIFLYLLDNKTSYVVLFSSGVGTLIEFWKVTKAMNVTLETPPGGWPRLRMQDRGSYVASKTKQYDDEAMRYLSWVLFPLIVGYSVYSLMYSEHKSWYSWALGSLVGCVYTFGFVLMCPQLYLNYKLKSVAHLPWRQMTYKFLNTIIDDLFAFVIKMPTLHRLSVFRDDLVFAVLIYQRWIYPVDKKRVNEFGFSDEPPPDAPAIDAAAPDAAEAAPEPIGANAQAAAPASVRKDATAKFEVAEADAEPVYSGPETRSRKSSKAN